MTLNEETRRWPFHAGALVLLAFLLWQTGEVASRSSATADEPIYIRSGLLLLHHGDPSINDISSPFLFKALNALPLMGMDAALHLEERPESNDWPPLLKEWRAGTDLVRSLGPKTVLPLARLVPRLTAAATGLLLYGAAFLAMGAWVGLFALAIYVFLPEAVAHASLATLESGLTFFTLLTLVLLYRFLEKPAYRWALLLGLSLALTLLTKTTGLVVALFVVLVFMVRWICVKEGRGRVALCFVVLVFSAWLLMNAAFSFKGTFDCLADRPEYSAMETRINSLAAPLVGPAAWAAVHVPLLLPSSYIHTLITQAGIAGKGKRIFFNSRYTESGWPWLMGLTFLIKMPIAFLVLIVFSCLFFRNSKAWLVFGGFACTLLLFFTVASQLNAGVRYLLPALPGLCLLAGSGLKPRWFHALPCAGLLIWLAVSTMLVHPHQLSYANELAGGPERLYRLLGDSNLDWGQDLPALAETMEREGIEEVKLSYFGSDDPAVYGIQYQALPSIGLKPRYGEPWWFEEAYRERFTLEGGVYAISANNLNGLYFRKRDLFTLFRSREPDFRAGYSILLYDVRTENP